MKLRGQLLTVSLVTLMVPWAGWMLVQELEAFLRDGQERALLAAAGAAAMALPDRFDAELARRGEAALPLRALPAPPQLDGYAADWAAADQRQTFLSEDGAVRLDLLAGRHGGQVFLHCLVADSASRSARPPGGLALFLRTARGQLGFYVDEGVPGAMVLDSRGEVGGQLRGHWQETRDGFQAEFALPRLAGEVEISLGTTVPEPIRSDAFARAVGTLERGRPARWLRLAPESPDLGEWLTALAPVGARAWLVDRSGWVMGRTAPAARPAGRQLTWVERVLYRAVAGSRTELRAARADDLARLDGETVQAALAGRTARSWEQDPENAVVRSTVAVPLLRDGLVRGAVLMEESTDGLLLVTNRALGRVMLTTLLLTLAVAAGLWLFATRLSRRVQRLSSAVSAAMDDAGRPGALPLVGDQDELGELARNNARLLRAVSEYTQYLRKLAGRLSHELKTPLAITRSSLENLASRPLDEEGRRYLERAREGIDRQAAIVRAMSEASRLEAAIGTSEWMRLDLREVLRSAAEAYRGLHAGREIRLDLPGHACEALCAPDLLAQALDKLVDNAVTLTEAGERVSITLRTQTDGFEIEVANTGTTLPDVLPDQLFDSLVSMRERGGGRHLGLGLYIVRLVAEAHGGQATARNLPNGGGVAFSLHLPQSE